MNAGAYNFHLKSGGYKNSTCCVHRAGLGKFLKLFVQNVAFSAIKLTTFHQKLCHACLKRGGYVPSNPKSGGTLPPRTPHTTLINVCNTF